MIRNFTGASEELSAQTTLGPETPTSGGNFDSFFALNHSYVGDMHIGGFNLRYNGSAV